MFFWSLLNCQDENVASSSILSSLKHGVQSKRTLAVEMTVTHTSGGGHAYKVCNILDSAVDFLILRVDDIQTGRQCRVHAAWEWLQ